MATALKAFFASKVDPASIERDTDPDDSQSEGCYKVQLEIKDSQYGSYRLWFRIERIIETFVALLALFSVSFVALQIPMIIIFSVAVKKIIDSDSDDITVAFVVLGSILACNLVLRVLSTVIYEAVLFVIDAWHGFTQFQKLLGVREFNTKKKIIKMFFVLTVFIIAPIIVVFFGNNSKSDYDGLAKLFITYVLVAYALFTVNFMLIFCKGIISASPRYGNYFSIFTYIKNVHWSNKELMESRWSEILTSPFVLTNAVCCVAVGLFAWIMFSEGNYLISPLIVISLCATFAHIIGLWKSKSSKFITFGEFVPFSRVALEYLIYLGPTLIYIIVWIATFVSNEIVLGIAIFSFALIDHLLTSFVIMNRDTKAMSAETLPGDILSYYLDQVRFYDVGMYYKIIPPAGLKRSEVDSLASAWRIDVVEKVSKYVGIAFVIASVFMVVGTGWSINFDTKYGGAIANSAQPYLPGPMKTPLVSRICSVQVGGYRTLDYAYFSQIAYLPHDEAREATNAWFGPYVFIDTPVADFDENLFYYGFMKDNTYVVSIRGPRNLKSWSVMSQIWRGSVTYQFLRFVLPWMYIWPNESGALLLDAVRLMIDSVASGQENKYVDKVVEYVKEMKASGREVILTGHSLGGGIAQVAAARTKTPAVTFSSPGIRLAYKTFDIADLDDAHDYGMNIYQSLDLVASIDKQGILAQELKCRGEISECQTIREGICEISNICGDPSGRDIILEPPSDAMCPNHNRIRL